MVVVFGCFLRSPTVVGFHLRKTFKRCIVPNSRATTTTTTTTTIQANTLSSDSSPVLKFPSHVIQWLDIQLPEGRCVGVSMMDVLGDSASFDEDMSKDSIQEHPDHWVHAMYHPDDVTYGVELPPAVASSFWMGRLAMRIALEFPGYPILKDSYGRPHLETGKFGSISHKQNVGVALVSQDKPGIAGVGVDIELTDRPGKRSIAPRVLTEAERNSLGALPGVSEEEEVLLRFSLKEAIYKAAHPLLCQYVSFQEAEVTPHADGTATCTWYMESRAHEALANVTAHWRRLDVDDGYFLTSASVQRARSAVR